MGRTVRDQLSCRATRTNPATRSAGSTTGLKVPAQREAARQTTDAFTLEKREGAMMAHTAHCANATNPRCKCSCQHSLHGASSGYFSPTQVARAREPILAEVARSDKWPTSLAADRSAVLGYSAALRLAKCDLDTQSAAASKLIVAGLVRGDLTQELVDSAVNSLMAHDGVAGNTAHDRAAKELELHLLCTLFWMAHQAAAGLQDALTRTSVSSSRRPFSCQIGLAPSTLQLSMASRMRSQRTLHQRQLRFSCNTSAPPTLTSCVCSP